MAKQFNRDVNLAGGSRLMKGDTEIINKDGAIIGDIQATAASIGTAELADLAVTSAKLGADAVSAASKIADDVIDSEHVAAGALDNEHYAASSVSADKVADSDGATGGAYVKKVGMAVYDFSVDGGSQGAVTLAETVTIPDNAIVTATHYDVLTTCTSSSDAATIAVTLPTDGAVSTAIAISDGTNPWDAGAHLSSVITPLAVKTTDARAVGITVAGGEDLTAGKVVFFVEYMVTA